MSELSYKIRVKKGDFEVEVVGDKEFVLQKYAELAAMPEGGRAPEGGPAAPAVPAAPSLAEFVKQKNPKSHINTVVVFAYHLSKFKDVDSYNVDDIDKCYLDSRVAKPTNTNVAMDSAVRRGFLMPLDAKKDGKKAWAITQSGEKYVEAGLKEGE